MKRLVFFLPLVITIIIFSFLLYYILQNKDISNPPSALLDEPVPIFNSVNFFDNDTNITNKIINEKKVLINFFASWCEPCKIEHNILMQISNNHKNILLLGFNFKDKKKEAINFIEKNGNPFDKIGIDNDGKIAMDFGVYGLPETFIVDKNGKIIFKHVGPITNKIYNNEIKKLLIK